jgi:glycerophosphoryl diester phosphodiesterase
MFRAFLISLLSASAVMPLNAQLAPAAPQTILVHGHRGSRATRPENTIPAFEYTIHHGADVIELDLAVTKDKCSRRLPLS